MKFLNYTSLFTDIRSHVWIHMQRDWNLNNDSPKKGQCSAINVSTISVSEEGYNYTIWYWRKFHFSSSTHEATHQYKNTLYRNTYSTRDRKKIIKSRFILLCCLCTIVPDCVVGDAYSPRYSFSLFAYTCFITMIYLWNDKHLSLNSASRSVHWLIE